jgi:hypothetical protein
MSLDKAQVLAEIDEVLGRFGASANNPFPPRRGNTGTIVGNVGQMTSGCMAALRRNAPSQGYIADAERAFEMNPIARVATLMGILATIRQDVEQGYLGTIEQQARDVVYDDFLEMAEDMASKRVGAVAAVVVAVSVLEEHVRKLAGANGIDVQRANGDCRSFEELVTDLGSGSDPSLTKTERRLLGGWYSQRTEAAHGHFDNVVVEDVGGIVSGVRNFIARHPA